MSVSLVVRSRDIGHQSGEAKKQREDGRYFGGGRAEWYSNSNLLDFVLKLHERRLVICCSLAIWI